MNADNWFDSLLDRDEAALEAGKVPKCYWGYILANGAPGTPQHDGLGAIYRKRKHLLASANRTMGVAVVDGRDIVTIRKWIGGRDWTQEQENKWLKSMTAKN